VYAASTVSLLESINMSHLPLNIDVRGMTILVVGGGAIAERKIKSLLATGATVRVVAPKLTPEITQLADTGTVSLKMGYYDPSDLHDAFLAVAATNDPATNRRIACEARQRGMLVSVADEPALGNCTFPAVLRRGNLEVSVSTTGTCPGFAAVVRDMIASVIGTEYGEILATLAIDRENLLTEGTPSTYNNLILRSRARELINELNKPKEQVP
jgi:precorrin-2 dehydrogenase/sirohydrochlorin ferrochelatase